MIMKKDYSKRHFIPIVICLMLLTCISIFTTSRESFAAAKKTTLAVTKQTIFVNGNYTIPLSNKIKKATYFYTSNKTKIAKVNKNGVITGISKGSASIKVRYKYKGDFNTVGQFKITVNKSTLKDSYNILNLKTGDTVSPDSYLNNINSDATYIITSSKSAVATSGDDGVIRAKKAGKTSMSIHEVYNKKSRTIGSVAVSVTGASVTREELRLAYGGDKVKKNDLIEDKTSTSTYNFTSSDTSLVYISGDYLYTRSYSSYSDQYCTITVTEKPVNEPVRTIGTIKITLTSKPFVSEINQKVTIGLGEELKLGTANGIIITNRQSGATYKFTPANTDILSNPKTGNPVGLKYGSTTVSITQTVGSTTTTLDEVVTVTVATANVKDELIKNGFTTTVGGNAYNGYPVDNRNSSATYYYESSDSTICTVNTAGINKNQDYLVLTPKKAGTVVVTVYETVPSENVKTKIGKFNVIINEAAGTTPGSTPAPGASPVPGTVEVVNPAAKDIISSVTLKHNDKTYTGTVSSSDLEVVFGDESGNYIDYGTDFSKLSSGDFAITTTSPKYSFAGIETIDGYEWTATIKLDDSSTVEVPISLIPGEFNTASVIKDINVQLGSVTKTINSSTYFPDDTSVKQFDDGNKNFMVSFKNSEYVAAGITEFDPAVISPVYMSDVPANTVRCAVTQNRFEQSNTSGNSAALSVSKAESSDNGYWTFSATFEDGTVEYFDVTLGVEN